MTVPADEPQTRQGQDANDGLGNGLVGDRDDDRDEGALAAPVVGVPAMNSGGGGAGVPVVAGLLAADDEDTTEEQARDAGEREVGGSDGPVGGTPLPR